jgi:hypothetical protein
MWAKIPTTKPLQEKRLGKNARTPRRWTVKRDSA